MKTEKLLKILKFRADQQVKASESGVGHCYPQIHQCLADLLLVIISDIEEAVKKEKIEEDLCIRKLRNMIRIQNG